MPGIDSPYSSVEIGRTLEYAQLRMGIPAPDKLRRRHVDNS